LLVNKRHLPSAFALFLLLLVLASSACSDVESCEKVTDLGCLNSVPKIDGTCLFDLVPRNGTCVKPGSEEDKCSLCAEGDLCVPERNECVNFCETPPILPGSVAAPEPIFCVATREPGMPDANPMLPYEEVCRRRCRLQCQRWAQHCPGFAGCEQGFCERPDVLVKCNVDCPPIAGAQRDLACLTRSCNDVRFSICDTRLSCPNGATPDCAAVTCTNDCQYNGQGLAGDGTCDDGDPASAETAFCAWGTDCVDCGPRKGVRKEPAFYGDICAFHVNCEGGTQSPLTARAWCILQETLPNVSRCAQDCSRDADCPDAFECRELKFGRQDGTEGPLVESGVTARACFPLLCP
jgi:hypothetical protein